MMKRRNGEFSRMAGVVLRARRLDLGVTQVELARRTDMSIDSIFRTEKRGLASIEAINAYAVALGTTASSVIAEVEERLAKKRERDAAIAQMREKAADLTEREQGRPPYP